MIQRHPPQRPGSTASSLDGPPRDEQGSLFDRSTVTVTVTARNDVAWCRRTTAVDGWASLYPWARRIYGKVKKNAEARGIECPLTQDEFYEVMCRCEGYCEVSGVRLSLQDRRDHGKRRPFAPSVDRIDPTRGYTPDNVRVVCVAANYAMSDWGEAVLLEIARGMVMRHGMGTPPTKHTGRNDRSLTPEQVAYIKAAPRTRHTATKLGKMFGVSRRKIYRILNGELYAWVTPAAPAECYEEGRVA